MTADQIVSAIDAALLETVEEVRAWNNSPANNGPWSEEVYRTNIHIIAALGIFGAKLKAQAKAIGGADNGK